jgi:hypothetical protein
MSNSSDRNDKSGLFDEQKEIKITNNQRIRVREQTTELESN